MKRQSKRTASAALTALSFVPMTFAGAHAEPAIASDPLEARYDPVLQMLVINDGERAFAASGDTTVAYCQFKRPTGTPSNRDWEYYDAPDGFKDD